MNKIVDIETLQREVCAWGQKQFPGQSLQSIVTHLAREAGELAEKPGDRSETADCLLLLLQVGDRQRMTAGQLISKADVYDPDRRRKKTTTIIEWTTRLERHVLELVMDPHDADETAICFMCLGNIAKHQGMTMGQLVECSAAKLEINKLRRDE